MLWAHKMSNFVKVEGSKGLYKNMTTGVVSNFDEEGLARAKAIKKNRLEEKKKIKSLEDEVKTLKDLVSSIIKSK